jgi:hypothetical protein
MPIDPKSGYNTISTDCNPMTYSMRLPSGGLSESTDSNRPNAEDPDECEIKKRANPGMYRELKNLKETAWLLKNFDKDKQGAL